MQMLLYCVYIKRGSEAASLALRLFSKLWRAPLFFFQWEKSVLTVSVGRRDVNAGNYWDI